MAEWQRGGVWIPGRTKSVTQGLSGKPGSRAMTTYRVERPTPQVLRSYYDNDGLYYEVQTALHQMGLWTAAMHPIRNPANASVEFFAATLWGNELTFESPNESALNDLDEIDRACNWAGKMPVMARWAAIYGDVFIKVVNEPDGTVGKTLLNPETIGSNFEEDGWGNLTFIRIEFPKGDGIYTEIWDMLGVRIWQHKLGLDVDPKNLGAPMIEILLSDMGLSYIPIVHGKFRDVGDKQGEGAYSRCLDPIDEANQVATRLHQMLFRANKPFYALEHINKDKQDRPLPPVKLDEDNTGVIEFADDVMLALPGGVTMKDVIPNIKYGDALSILNAHMTYIQEFYLPELGWYHVPDQQISGRALRTKLSSAVARCEEARTNMDAALIRADQVALELYGSGADVELSLAERPVIPDDSFDQATEAAQWSAAGFPVEMIAKHVGGWSEEDIQLLAENRQTNLANALMQFNTGASGSA